MAKTSASRHLNHQADITKMLMVITTVLCLCVCYSCGHAPPQEPNDLQHQLTVLSKQVTALLDRRREDIEIIEDNMKSTLFKSKELLQVKEEMKTLRQELDELRGKSQTHLAAKGSTVASATSMADAAEMPLVTQNGNQQRNDHLTVKWLSASMSELRTELSEFQKVLNASVLLQEKEETDVELSLLRTEVANLGRDVEAQRNKNALYEDQVSELKQEVASLKESARMSSVTCANLKSQIKTTQLEWIYNFKTFQQKNMEKDNGIEMRPARHQRLLRKHVLELEKSSTQLKKNNEMLLNKVEFLESQMSKLQKSTKWHKRLNNIDVDVDDKKDNNQDEKENAININNDQEVILVERLTALEAKQTNNELSMFNLSQQLSNYDKLHISMLELLENVESIESKVDKNMPDFRKEISKLEFQMSQTVAKIASLKEDQKNTRESVKAISFSVSNLRDKFDKQNSLFGQFNKTVEHLKESATVQNSKLHDHILKTESSTVDLNSTKSTIHLVEELRTFENEYKSIVNKLPADCSAVLGPSGVYLISPGSGEGGPIMAACQDGWTIIQRRYDGSVNFNRKWNEYSSGFGTVNGEYWLGNRVLHSLTRDNCSQLQINMEDIYGKFWQANYGHFYVSDYSGGFQLTVASYSGNASNALDYQNKMEFSTVDNDRDISNTHCASNYEGGWWFSHCQHANLNGRYNLGLTWFDSSRNEWIAVAKTEMKVKRRQNC